MPKKSLTPSAKKSRAKPAGTAASTLKQPTAIRPTVPADYGIATDSKGLLDWGWARERVTGSHNYVIVTVRPDGRPHAMGMHGLWWDDAFYFGTGETTRKAKNLAANPRCILLNERLDELIIVEGVAESVDARHLPVGTSPASQKKYGWPMGPMKGSVVFKVIPQVVFAFPEKQFAKATTKWLFA